MSARSHARFTDVLITLGVGAVLLAAAQAEALRNVVARAEQRVFGRPRVLESAFVRAAARTAEGVLRAVEAQTYDRRLELRAALNPCRLDARLVVVEIDDSSLAHFGRWPWPRDRQARLLEGLARAGARGALLDIEYPETSGDSGAHLDEALARAFSLLPTHGMMYTRELPGPYQLARRQQESRIMEWLLGGASGLPEAGKPDLGIQAGLRPGPRSPLLAPARPPPSFSLPTDILALAGNDDRLRHHADDVVRLGRHLLRRATADLMDAVREGVFPDLTMPDPPPGSESLHPVMLLPLALGVVSEGGTEGPDEMSRTDRDPTIPEMSRTDRDPTIPEMSRTDRDPTIPEMVERLGLAAGFPADRLASNAPVRRHLTEVVKLLSARRDRVSRLSMLLSRLRESLEDRQMITTLEQDALATPTTAAASAAARSGLPARLLETRLVRLLDRRRSASRLQERDLVEVTGNPLPDLPRRGEINPPIPLLNLAYRGAGLSVVDRDPDGTLRRASMTFRVDSSFPGGRSGAGDPAGSLTVGLQATLAPAASLLDLDLKRMVFAGDSLVIPGTRGGVAIPVDASGAALVDFRGRWGRDGFPRLAAGQVLEVGALRDRLDAYLRASAEYSDLDLVARAFERPAPLSGAGGLARALAPEGLPLVFAWWKTRAAVLARDRDQVGRDALEKLRLDLKSAVQGLQDAQAIKDSATEAEAVAEIERLRPDYDRFLVSLPLLEAKLKRAVAGRFCLVGVTSTSTTDISVVPLERRYINLGFHVNLLNQVLSGSQLRQAPFYTNDLPILAIYLILMPLVLPAFSIRGGALATLLLLVVHLLVATWAIVYRALWIQVGVPVIAVSTGYLLITLRRYLQDERQKQQIREMFETYLDPKVVELMVEDESLWRELGGTVRTITPFFSDLAGFATASELLGPDELSELLADYLTPMTDIILKHGGIRERYVGDAIVAFFGAPVVFPDHAARACLASVEQIETIVRLRAEWWAARVPWYVKIREHGLDLRFRIGVTTGPAKVGNFGSRSVKNYSMNGDVVNLASRLEGANKVYGTEMLCSEQTYLEATAVVEAREVDLIQVVGKSLPVRIFEVLGRKGELPAPRDQLPARFAQALAVYRARRFDEARTTFQALLATYPDDGPTRTYLARLDDAPYLASRKPDWDGSWVAATK